MNEDPEGAQLIQDIARPQVSNIYVLTTGAHSFNIDGTPILAQRKFKTRCLTELSIIRWIKLNPVKDKHTVYTTDYRSLRWIKFE